ncbi:uncharacterized protein LOC143027167 [Oratosquilla oratoria]|uniref:uncharacterized protein LOC143027167 n=1 Tax=Oratosquilla oratoria TaxID=337810 RepID=UPI003F76C20A
MAASSEFTQETFRCPVCYEDYNETHHSPMVLGKCGHSICSSCLNPLTRNGRVTCPKCRVITGSNDIKINYDLRTAAIIIRGQEKEDCEKEDCEKEDFKESGSRRYQCPPRHQCPPRQENPPQQEQESCNDMTNWLAAGAVLVGAAVFGITGFALGRTSNKPRK